MIPFSRLKRKMNTKISGLCDKNIEKSLVQNSKCKIITNTVYEIEILTSKKRIITYSLLKAKS